MMATKMSAARLLSCAVSAGLRSRGLALASCLALGLAGCVGTPTAGDRAGSAMALASAQGWGMLDLAQGSFHLAAFAPQDVRPDTRLTIYIEGDGLAWSSPTTPSPDPTPRDPVALRLALAQPSGNAAYLARPCQYLGAAKAGCAQAYWTDARFAPEVVGAMNGAVSTLKARFGAQRIQLVGYSGGGALAALIAARRSDVTRVVTVAGNLDHAEWTTHHDLTPMARSLNAAAVAPALSGLSQVHFIGANDRVIPPDLARAWPKGFTGAADENLKIVPGFDHRCCWADAWGSLFNGTF